MEFSLKLDPATARDLDKALAAIKQNVQRKVLGQAARKAMKPIRATARALVPRRYGTLRKSLGTVQKKYKGSGLIMTWVGPRTGFKDPQTGANPIKYAHLVEKGTQPHLIRRKDGSTYTHPGSTPKSFIRKAFNQNAAQGVTILAREVRNGILNEVIKHKPPTFFRGTL